MWRTVELLNDIVISSDSSTIFPRWQALLLSYLKTLTKYYLNFMKIKHLFMALAIAAATFVTTSCEEEGPIVTKHPQPDPEEQEPGEQDPDAIYPEGAYYPEQIPTLDE